MLRQINRKSISLLSSYPFKEIISKWWFPPLGLLLIPTLLFSRAIFGEENIIPVDFEFISQWYPYRLFYKSVLLKGQFPLWTHNLPGGFPLGAFPHAGCFYPLNLIWSILDYPQASTYFHYIHLLIAPLLMYGLLREFGSSRFSSWILSVSWCLAGPVIHSMYSPPFFMAHVWTPGVFWASLRLVRQGGILYFIALSFLFTMSYLSGDVEIVIYSLLTLLAFIIFFEKPAWKRLCLLFASISLGIIIVSPQLLVTSLYLNYSFRNINPAQSTELSRLFLLFSTNFFVPSIVTFTRTWAWYLGLIPFLGIFIRSKEYETKKAKHIFIFLCIIIYIYGLNLWPFCHIFNIIPVLGNFGAIDMRRKALSALIIILYILSAKGIDALLEGINKKNARWLLGLILIFILFQANWLIDGYKETGIIFNFSISRCILILALLLMILNQFIIYLKNKKDIFILKPSHLIIILALDLATMAYENLPGNNMDFLKPPININLFKNLREHDRIYTTSRDTFPLLMKMLRMGEGPGYWMSAIRNDLNSIHELRLKINPESINYFDYRNISEANQPLFNYLSFKYLIADKVPVWSCDPLLLDSPFIQSKYYISDMDIYTKPLAGEGKHLMRPGNTLEFQADLIPGDTLYMDVEPSPEYPPDLLSVILVRDDTDYHISDNILVHSMPRLNAATVEYPLPVSENGSYFVNIHLKKPSKTLFKLSNLKISNKRRNYGIVYDGSVQIYENRNSLQRYGVYTNVGILNKEDILDALFDPETFDPARQILMTPDQIEPTIPVAIHRLRNKFDVAVLEYTPNKVTLRTNLEFPCYLSIAETYYPGWRAWVNDKEVRIKKANYAFQAVPLTKPGYNRIALQFNPVEFEIGLWVCITTLAFFIIIAISIIFSGLTKKHKC